MRFGLPAVLRSTTAALSMSDNGAAVRQLVDRLYQSHDAHLIKFIRNLAMHEEIAAHLAPFTADLIALAQERGNQRGVAHQIKK